MELAIIYFYGLSLLLFLFNIITLPKLIDKLPTTYYTKDACIAFNRQLNNYAYWFFINGSTILACYIFLIFGDYIEISIWRNAVLMLISLYIILSAFFIGKFLRTIENFYKSVIVEEFGKKELKRKEK